jgi:uncharacterized protein (DUF302 family)
MDRVEAEIRAQRMTVFARIDHAGGAALVGLKLAPTELIVAQAQTGRFVSQKQDIA